MAKASSKRRRTLASRARPSYDCATGSRSTLDFHILGPLEATRGKRALALGSPKQRAVLAFLLLHANELVARDRLIEELWGESAPATVNAVLNGYLSKLRRLLADGDGAEVLATQAPGYVLRVPAERLDARRFEALREQGREALRHGGAEQAAAALRAALSLWRGPALADLAYEPFAQTEIRRLEELRLAALEDRIEAELALGRHEALVAELEALVAEHPYRERLHAQLMLALYRSGRQAEALDVYRRARRTLAEQLGIDPGPRLQELERAILRQDASLEPPQLRSTPTKEAPRPPPRRRPRRTTIAVVLAAGVVLALAAAVVAVLRNSSTSSPKSVRLAGNSVAIVDPATDLIVREVPVGGRPMGIAVGYGSVWVGNRDERTLLRIDARSRTIVRRFGLGSIPVDVAAGAGSVWVLTETSRVVRIDPDSNGITATITLPPATVVRSSHMALGGGGVWVAHAGAISRIDPTTNKVATIREGLGWQIVYGEDALWAVAGNQIERIDPKTNEVVDSISLPRLGRVVTLGGLAAGGGALWSGTGADQTLFKIDPGTGRVIGGVSLGYRIGGVAFDEGDVWIAGRTETLLRVDLASERVVKTIPLGVRFAPGPWSARGPIAVGEGAVWVTTMWP